MHLDVAANSKTVTVVPPKSVNGTEVGRIFEARHFRTLLLTVATGVLGSDLTVTLEEADEATGTFTPVAEATSLVPQANPTGRALLQFDLSPRKPFLRFSVAATAASFVGLSALLWFPSDTREQLGADDVPDLFLLR